MSLSRQNRQYTARDLQYAIDLVENENKSLYAASKATGVPWSTLKDYLNRDDKSQAKLGRPFALTSDAELKLFNHIIEMQEIGFGLTVNQLRDIAFELAQAENRECLLNPNSETASKWWWDSFKKRYNLTLRVAENLSACRASMANLALIGDFYTKLEILLNNLGIKDCADRIWNCDETGLTYVTNKGRVVTAIGRRYIYNRTYAEKGTTTTVMGCICADGTWLPPLVIFKGVRWSDTLKQDALPNAMVRLSPKGWINAEIFLEWFKFFIKAIPDARPVVLLMDSYASHIKPEVITLARENQIYLLTFPAHNSHILQPLDVGVYKALKSYWSDSVKDFMKKNTTQKPDRSNFHQILNPAFVKAFSSNTIKNAFRKCGICPLNKDSISPESLAPSRLTTQPPTNTTVSDNASAAIENILSIPRPNPTQNARRQADSSARCLNDEAIAGPSSRVEEADVEQTLNIYATEVAQSNTTNRQSELLPGSLIDETVAGPSKPAEEPEAEVPAQKKRRKPEKQKENKITGKKVRTNKKNDDDWICCVCKVAYSDDAKLKNGKKWAQCSYCCRPFHNICLHIAPNEDDLYVQCDDCAEIE